MEFFETVKVFDLSNAPDELRQADDLADLRPSSATDEGAILSLQVGRYHSVKDGLIYDNITQDITMTEYRLHRWLTEHGAREGENVLLRWKGHADW